jgi:hypothetical protein
VTDCDVVVCDDRANYLLQLDRTDFRTWCGSCLDERRDSYPGDLDVVRHL